MAYILGIDTGGTYTDSVVFDDVSKKVLCWSKSPTTRQDLCVGIRKSLQGLDFREFSRIAQVSLSTTLATNAVVENRRCPTGLLVLGKAPQGEFPAQSTALIDGRINIRGKEELALDLSQARQAILDMKDSVRAFAVSGYASVRNPSHEQQVRKLVRELTDAPVFCAHELCGDLGYYERTVTTVLNASLTEVVWQFCRAARRVLEEFSVGGSIMIVKGDGSLMSLENAMERPVETILSGPAASVAGAKFLSGLQDAFILDMGGTTTDIANLEGGRIQVNESGARVGGWYTQVHAVQVSTHGIGGDSRITWDRAGQTLSVGPERIRPLGRQDEGTGDSGLTPSDCKYIQSGQDHWDSARSREGLLCFAREAGRCPEALLTEIEETVYLELLTSCVQAAADFEGEEIDLRADAAAQYMLAKAWDQNARSFQMALCLKKPIVAVGGPVRQWLPEIGRRLGCETVIPEFAQVANAVGAALMEIREHCASVIRKERGSEEVYLCFLPQERIVLHGKEEAVAFTKKKTEAFAKHIAQAAGCPVPKIETSIQEILLDSAEGPELVEIQVYAEAHGRPY